uniref:Uncharacterized protein n=1 Tax=Fagus sylvatica TaxID=28930 RepID=A0A2N9FDH2_FAGSY
MAEEASKLRGLEARVAALETKFNFLLQFIRRWTEREERRRRRQTISLSKAAQTNSKRPDLFHCPTTICLADQEEDDYARQPEDAYRATAQRLQQRPDL